MKCCAGIAEERSRQGGLHRVRCHPRSGAPHSSERCLARWHCQQTTSQFSRSSPPAGTLGSTAHAPGFSSRRRSRSERDLLQRAPSWCQACPGRLHSHRPPARCQAKVTVFSEKPMTHAPFRACVPPRFPRCAMCGRPPTSSAETGSGIPESHPLLGKPGRSTGYTSKAARQWMRSVGPRGGVQAKGVRGL